LIALEATGFLLSAWLMSLDPSVGWVGALLVGACVLATIAFYFRSALAEGTSVPSYEQLPYSWGAFAGMAVGSGVGSAGILGVNLAIGETFYAQVSQVIPVLLLTFAVEQRFFTSLRHPDTRDDAEVAFAFVMVTAAVAEVLVLTSLATSTVWVHWAATIASAAAIPASLALITVSAFVHAFRNPIQESEVASPK
jgi:hypothetical protein